MALATVYHYQSEWMQFIAEVKKKTQMRVDLSEIQDIVSIGNR